MQALQLKQYGGPDHVAFAELPRPTPGPGELLVQVHAVGLNPIDKQIPSGDFKPILKLRSSATLGRDLAGAGSIRHVIDQVFPFLAAQQALAYLAQGRARGKVVVRMPVP